MQTKTSPQKHQTKQRIESDTY